jgi:hypothetical protein
VLDDLPSADPSHAFNNAVEPSIAAHGGTLVVAFIALHLDEGSFDVANASDFRKQVGTTSCSDVCTTFRDSVQLSTATASTDPVVRVGADGRYWLALHDDDTDAINLFTSFAPQAWAKTVTQGLVGDKEWLGVDGSTVFVANTGGFAKYAADGQSLGQATPGAQMASAYVDALGVHFLTVTDATERAVELWDGASPTPTAEGPVLDTGDASGTFTNSSGAIGVTADGAQWIVRSTRWNDGRADVLLRVGSSSGGGTDVPISAPGEIAFLPAAGLDSEGRLHVAYYDSGTQPGRLVYRRSKSTDLTAGFGPEIVLDDSACPAGFYPFFSTPMGGRRLREYIDIALDGSTVYVAWTHAPIAPSRVHVARGQF